MNIRLRLTLWYTAIFSLILVLFSLAVYVGLTRSLLNTVDNHLQREVSEILGNLEFETDHDDDYDHDDHEDELDDDQEETNESDDSRGVTAPGVELNYIPEEGVFWRVLDDQGQSIIDYGYFDNAEFTAQPAALTQAQLENTTLADGTPIRLYTTPFVLDHQNSGIVQVAESYQHLQDVQNQLVTLLLIGIPLTLLASSLGGWFLAASALDPIDRITRAAQQISAQDLHQRLNLQLPNDEVGRLAATFDEMLARLENAFKQQRRFLADASHEMKTPLTILKGDVEVALNRPRTPEHYQETLFMVNDTTDRLIELVQELLTLARADSNQLLLHIESFNLTDLLQQQMTSLMPRAIQKEITLHLDAPPQLMMQGDQRKLRRLFINLIDNALKYSNSGGAITIRTTTTETQVQVEVSDTGPGIADEHLPHLFERFYRADKARSHASTNGTGSGAGLGLSIVQWLVEVHGGHITVDSQVGRGSTFTVRLPLAQPSVSTPKQKDELA